MKDLLNKIKNWMINNWMPIVNFFIIIISYLIVKDHEEVAFAETILGLWIIFSMGYFIYDTFFKHKKPL